MFFAQPWRLVFARLARMSPDRDRADHLEPLPIIAVSIRPGEQLTGIAVLGVLVPGAVCRPRGDGERPGPRRLGRTRLHQSRDLGRLLGRAPSLIRICTTAQATIESGNFAASSSATSTGPACGSSSRL